MDLYAESHKYLLTDSYMFTQSFQSATNGSSAFARANCLQCYERDAQKIPGTEPKIEVQTYLKLYEQTKKCILEKQYIEFHNETLICQDCRKEFTKSQKYFEQFILGNSSVYQVFTGLCLDVADRYQELNQLFEGYNCKPNLTQRTSLAMDIGGFSVLVFIFLGCYWPTISYKITGSSTYWNEGTYVQPLLHASVAKPMQFESLDNFSLPRATCNLCNEVSA